MKLFITFFLALNLLSAASLRLSFHSSADKVFPDAAGTPGEATHKVAMARGEYESFQLLVRAEVGPLRNVRVSTDAPGARLSVVGYVETKPDDRRPWGKPIRLGWWPDPLLPNRPFDVAAGETQPVWITLHTAPGAKAGTTRYRLTARADGGATARASFDVQVYPVDLPRQQTYRNAAFMPAGNLNAHYRPEGGLDGASFHALYKRWLRFAFEHHLGPAFDMAMGWNQTKLRGPLEAGSLGPTLDMTGHPDGAGGRSYLSWPVRPTADGYDFRLAGELLDIGREYGLRQFCIGLFDRDERWDQQNPATHAEMASLLRAYVAILSRRGQAQDAFVYNADEPGPKMWPTVKKNFEFIRSINPKLKTWLCLNEPTGVRALTGFTDIWDVYIQQYEKSGIEERRKAGDPVIWALCVYPHDRPNLFIEYPAIDARMVGWLSWVYGVSGFEYWGINQWGPNTGRRDWASFDSGSTRTRWQRTKWPLGDGWLAYPGPDGAPLSSVRFENLRDGFEDAELLRLLAARGREKQAREIAERIARTSKDYAQDPDKVDAAHAALLEELARP